MNAGTTRRRVLSAVIFAVVIAGAATTLACGQGATSAALTGPADGSNPVVLRVFMESLRPGLTAYYSGTHHLDQANNFLAAKNIRKAALGYALAGREYRQAANAIDSTSNYGWFHSKPALVSALRRAATVEGRFGKWSWS
jgi:hypothetical protein